jgi:hypothetical protein
MIISDFTYMLALGFAAYVIFSLFYERAIRPMLCDRTRFKLFALRDQLRRLAIDSEIQATSPEYQYLERLICKLVDKCPWFSWGSFFEFLYRHRDAELSIEAKHFNENADPQLKAIYVQAVDGMTRLLLTNSPVWTVVLGVCLGAALIFNEAWRQWIEIQKMIFLEESLIDSGMVTA